MSSTEHDDAGTARAEALMALREGFADPGVLERVHVRDFETDHRHSDGSSGPALRIPGPAGSETWHRLDEAAGRALGAYVAQLHAGPGAYLFATADVLEAAPPSARDPRGV